MAFGTAVVGTTAYSASGGTSVAPSYPASIVATDQLVMIIGQKPSTANSGTVTTPSGWTLREELTAAGGYGATLGADTGNTNLRIYTKDTVTAGLTGTVTVTIGTNNVSWANITRVPTDGGTISYGSADGQRTTTPTSPLSVALTDGTSATAFAAGDFAIWAMCIPTDVTTPAQFSVHTITSSGITFNATAELVEPDSATGNDIGGFVARVVVSTGTGGGAPTVGATLAGTLTNVRGPIALLRMRETLAVRTGDLAATETGSDTFAATGDVLVDGTFAATETGSDTFAADGTVFTPPSGTTGDLAVTETGSDTFTSIGDVIVAGTLAATESVDTFTSTGDVIVKGSLAVSETGSDTFTSTGKVIVKGTLTATETGSDTFSASGGAFTTGDMAATETVSDAFAADGMVFTITATGTLAVTEAGSDGFGGYAAGYVEPGYVGGVSGRVYWNYPPEDTVQAGLKYGANGEFTGTMTGGTGHATLKYWDGSAWVIKGMNYWNGSSWI